MTNTTLKAEPEAERRAWELLTRNFQWDPPAHLGVKVRRRDAKSMGPVRLQVFEVAVAAVFAQMQPSYEWEVSPDLPDGGSDFVGHQLFLVDDLLEIAAGVTVGGQCKKRSRVDNIVDEVSGSLTNMMTTIDPTFFVVAFSARLTKERIKEACSRLETAHHRHCHILDRTQIEGLFRAYWSVLYEILSAALSADQAEEVRKYLASADAGSSSSISASAPPRILSGAPFGVKVEFPSFVGAAQDARLWWRPSGEYEAADVPITLIGPIGADSPEGMSLASVATDDPIPTQCSLELLTYSVGNMELGEVLIGPPGSEGSDTAEWTPLGTVQVIENLSPRFYERPLRGALARLGSEYERALAGAVASVGVVGAGGSGKSRLGEEFALRQRRRGASVVVAKQAKTLDDPHRILADLFLGLVGEAPLLEDPAERVIRAVEAYDAALGVRTEAAIKSLFGLEDGESTARTEQDLLPALLLLVAVKSRRAPLIIHLQELHWCSADVLLLLEKLVWQLDRILPDFHAAEGSPESGVLFIFEGRVRERQRMGDDGWDSEPFEALLQKLDCPTVTCSFDPEQGLEFIRRLFEDRHSAHRRVNLDLLEMQRELVERIHRAAGGNPFHSLEQLQLLKERRIVGQNPVTGFLYLIQPAPSGTLLPDSVFEAIKLRWTYMKSRMPELALLVWGIGLLDDRMPTPLFRRLRAELAPEISLADIDGSEMLWTGEDEDDEVAFRHENYFESIRRFEVSREDRERAVKVYCDWFAETEQADRPVDRFKWGLALLQLPVPDEDQAEALMGSALRDARDRGDLRLARRVQAASLDLAWKRDDRAPVEVDAFLRRSEEELWLTNELLGSGDRSRAARRLGRLSGRLERRVADAQPSSTEAVAELRRLQLTADVRCSQILFNDRKPVEAADLAGGAVRSIRGVRSGKGFDDPAWEELEMEALHSEAVALAIAGDIEPSLTTSAEAVELARRSSSVLAQHVISTYANILMSRDPETSESILRQCLEELDETAEAVEARVSARINLAMTLVIQAHRLDPGEVDARQALLPEAEETLKSVFSRAFQLGRYPDAGAAALMLGIISAMREDGDEVSWFAQAVAAAARGRQMETLWRAHINLATAMNRSGDATADDVRDHAVAALEILEETLSPYPEPDRSARFELVRVSLAQAVRFLHATDAASARAVLERYPALRSSFAGSNLDSLKEPDHDGWRHEWWLRVNGEPYSLY